MDQIKSFRDFGIKPEIKNFVGDKISTKRILGKPIIVHGFKVGPSKFEAKGECLDLQIEYDSEMRLVFTSGKYLIQVLQQLKKDQFPFKTKIVEVEGHYEFS